MRLLEADEPPLPAPGNTPVPASDKDEKEEPEAKGKKGAKKAAKAKPAEEEEKPPVAAELDEAALAQERRAQKRAALFAQVVVIGWGTKSAKLIDLVQRASAYLLAKTFTKVSDRDLRTEQAKACYAVAETLIHTLQKGGLRLGARMVRAAPPLWPPPVPPPPVPLPPDMQSGPDMPLACGRETGSQ